MYLYLIKEGRKREKMDPEVIKELSTKISSHPNPPEPKGIVSIAVQLIRGDIYFKKCWKGQDGQVENLQ